ncbi:MAG TPA: hypothetical protein VFW23_09085 [Tepidisphaeraceae bacterium]|nr:hypothetical protein [Tepidisphaeraceae bacterium]
MQANQNSSVRARGRFWRIVFWFTLIHLFVVGFMAVAVLLQMESGELFHTFHPKELGLINATSLWLFLNMSLVWCALTLADVAALSFTWRWARRLSCPRWMVIAYLAATLVLAAVYGAAAVNAAMIGTFHWGAMTDAIGTEVIRPLVIWDAIFVLPALFILARLIFSGWPTRAPGMCVSCGYDLTGNTSGVCPECGTPTTDK